MTELLHKVQVASPAKVNLHLGIKTQVIDGYHELETVFHALELSDTLTFELLDGYSGDEPLVIHCTPDVGIAPAENLVSKAIIAYADALGRAPVEAGQQLIVHIDKQIPLKGGLGGGSSNAAATLVACAQLWGTSPLDEIALDVAAHLGADVTFFLYGGCAFMVGKGEQLRARIEPLVAPVVLMSCGEGLSTAAVYHEFDEMSQEAKPLVELQQALLSFSSDREVQVASHLHNNLAAAAARLSPQVAQSLTWLAQQEGVLGSLLTGSGSAAFAICADETAADTLVQRIKQECGFWACATHFSRTGAHLIEAGK